MRQNAVWICVGDRPRSGFSGLKILSTMSLRNGWIFAKHADEKETDEQFCVGDRVKLSELGRLRIRRTGKHSGSVVSAPKKGGKSVSVLFDGKKRPTAVHRAYIERA